MVFGSRGRNAYQPRGTRGIENALALLGPRLPEFWILLDGLEAPEFPQTGTALGRALKRTPVPGHELEPGLSQGSVFTLPAPDHRATDSRT